MKPYLVVLRQILAEGVRQKNRTGVDTLMIPGVMMQFDMRDGFPAMTTKKLAFGAVAAELCGFIRGVESAVDFRELGTRIWDANANENKDWLKNPHRKGTDDLGRIYGVQWRRWETPGSRKYLNPPVEKVDQLARVLDQLENDPTSRRIIMTAWNPGELDQMALPPCHLLCQFLVQQEGSVLHATMYQRSCDMFLGVPFNIASYALLLHLVAKATGYVSGKLTMFLADAHVYVNHLDQVQEQLTRYPQKLPSLAFLPGCLEWLNDGSLSPLSWLEALRPDAVELVGYNFHPAIKAPMAV